MYFYSFCQDALSREILQVLPLLGQVFFWFINFDPPKNEFPMVNLVWSIICVWYLAFSNKSTNPHKLFSQEHYSSRIFHFQVFFNLQHPKGILKKNQGSWDNRKPGFFVCFEYIEDPTKLKLLPILPPKRPILVSAHAQNLLRQIL